MTTRRTSLLAGTILGGALLLGTAGLTLAQDPTSTPSPSPATGTPGGMMGGQGGMMGGQDVAEVHAAMERDGTCDPALMQSMHGTACSGSLTASDDAGS